MDIHKKISPLRQFLTDPDRPTLAVLDLGLLAIWIIGAWLQAFMSLARAFSRIGARTGHRMSIAVKNTQEEVRRSLTQAHEATREAVKKNAEQVTHNVVRSQQAVVEATTNTASTVASTLSSVIEQIVHAITAPFRFVGNVVLASVRAVATIAKAFSIALRYGAHELNQQSKIIWRELHASARYRAQRTAHIVCHPSAVIQPPQGWHTALISFAAMAMIFALPFPAVYAVQEAKKTEKAAMSSALEGLDAFHDAYNAITHQDTATAEKSFAIAYTKFEEADSIVHQMNPTLLSVARRMPVEGARIEGAERLLDGGKELAIAGQGMARILDTLTNENALRGNTIDLNNSIAPDLDAVVEHLDNANGLITPDIAKTLPEQYRDQVAGAQSNLQNLTEVLHDLSSLSHIWGDALGNDVPHRYLLVFQNNSELRPTGGFMGSYAVVDVSGGMIKKITTPGGGPYDLQGSLRAKVIAPQPLHLINATWQLQDSNWFPDFPTSAKKIEWFYEQSGQSSIDGIIAINASVIEDLLKFTGPIEMPEYKKTITAENAIREMQGAVELEYDKKKNKPKQFIADLLPKIMGQLGDGDRKHYLELLQIMTRVGVQKDVQIYLKDQKAQDVVERLGLDGSIHDTSGDYLSVIDTNIGGGKTDAVIDSDLHQRVDIAQDGSLTTTLTLTRTHKGIKGDPFSGFENTDFIRFYVPEGSVLVSASGFTIPERNEFENPPEDYQQDADLQATQGEVFWDEKGMFVNKEFGKTVLSNWMRVAPGHTETVTVSYRLPFTLDELKGKNDNKSIYSLLLQKQSGNNKRSYTLEVVGPTGSTIKTTYSPSTANEEGSHWQAQQEKLVSDQFFALEVQ